MTTAMPCAMTDPVRYPMTDPVTGAMTAEVGGERRVVRRSEVRRTVVARTEVRVAVVGRPKVGRAVVGRPVVGRTIGRRPVVRLCPASIENIFVAPRTARGSLLWRRGAACDEYNGEQQRKQQSMVRHSTCSFSHTPSMDRPNHLTFPLTGEWPRLDQEQQPRIAREAQCESARARRLQPEKPRPVEYRPDGSARRRTEDGRQARIQDLERRTADARSDHPKETSR